MCRQRLAVEMEAASAALDFEAAALLRDRIRALSLVQGHQDINVPGIDDADVIAAHQAGGQTCVQVFFFRGGQNWGNRAYFPSHDRQLGGRGGADAALSASSTTTGRSRRWCC